jgi:hypothetical protein
VSGEARINDDETRAGRCLCPSAQCEPGAILLGIVGADGLVGYITPKVTVDEHFVTEAHKGRAPEKRFRFSQPCVTTGCTNWTGTRCGVIDAVLNEVAERDLSRVDRHSLPKCSIRSRCRWFAQDRTEACLVCPLVITDLRPVEIASSD